MNASGRPAGEGVTHLVVGPRSHGVVRHAEQLLSTEAMAGVPVVRLESFEALDDLAADVLPARLHLHVTDNVLGSDATDAADRIERLAQGRVLTASLHDLPHPEDDHARYERRRRAYGRIAQVCRSVVVASEHERSLLTSCGADPRRCVVVPLPLDRWDETDEPGAPAPGTTTAPTATPSATTTALPWDGPCVAVLGHIYPDKGHLDVLHAMVDIDPSVAFVALGAVTPGHEPLVARLQAVAAEQGRQLIVTGFVEDDDLPRHLAGVTVPVAAHHAVSASASVTTWIEAGRVPIVTPGPWVLETAQRMPGCVSIVRDISGAIGRALTDPDLTRLPEDVELSPSREEAGMLLAEVTETGEALISVVIPWYDDQARLEKVLAALDAQAWPASQMEVVVADDGSPVPPVTGSHDYPVATVRQDDGGFRAAAARNLGAAATGGRVVLFLDGDTIPEPGFVEAIVTPILAGEADLVVGRRRHADLAGLDVEETMAFLRGISVRQVTPASPVAGGAPDPDEVVRRVPLLPEPRWLAQGYEQTEDLRAADDRSYRYVISSVLAVRRSLLDELDGFDPVFVGYGGEDWDLAHRAWLAGARFRHVPDAVAWHDGLDFAGRSDEEHRARTKNAESLRLAAILPDRQARARGVIWDVPEIVAEVDVSGMNPATALLVCAQLLEGSDSRVWLRGTPADVEAAITAWPWSDPRVRVGPGPQRICERAPWQVVVHGAARLVGMTLEQVVDLGEWHYLSDEGTAEMTVRRTRSTNMAAPPPGTVRVSWLRPVKPGVPSLEATWGWSADW